MSSHDGDKKPVSSDDDGDRIIDGARFPRQERQIDQLGFETTKHSLRFRGVDWDIPLTQNRDQLTANFLDDAADATDEPREHIQNLRFVVNETYLHVKFTVRHKAHISAKEVQSKLAKCEWKRVKTLYKPREKKARTAPRRARANPAGDDLNATHRQISSNLSFFGRVEEPKFHDDVDRDEEPAPYEEMQAAKAKKRVSRLATIGFA